MRLWAVILAVLVMWFAVLPQAATLPASQSCEAGTCANTCNSEGEDTDTPNDCCPDGACNPFQQCACCSFIVATPFTFTISHSLPYTCMHSAKPVSVLLASYSADCFHPPEGSV